MDEKKVSEKSGKEKNKKFFNKVKVYLKFVAGAYIVLIIALILIKSTNDEKKNIYYKIGQNSLASVTMKDAYTIREIVIKPFAAMGKNKDYKTMYSMLTNEYKRFKTYDEYVQTLEDIDWDTFAMESIKSKEENAYEARITYRRGKEEKVEDKEEVHTTYMLYNSTFASDVFTISPDGYIWIL
jgi:hypothetical protein